MLITRPKHKESQNERPTCFSLHYMHCRPILIGGLSAVSSANDVVRLFLFSFEMVMTSVSRGITKRQNRIHEIRISVYLLTATTHKRRDGAAASPCIYAAINHRQRRRVNWRESLLSTLLCGHID